MHYKSKQYRHPAGWSRLASSDLTIIKREWWKALQPKKTVPFTGPLNYIIFTYTRGEQCFKKAECIKIIQDLQKKHMDEGLPDIQYNFLIGGDKNVYEGRGWTTKPEISQQFPELFGKSVEVAYIGDYSIETNKDPSKKMWDKGWQIIRYACDNDIMKEMELRFDWVFDQEEKDFRDYIIKDGGNIEILDPEKLPPSRLL